MSAAPGAATEAAEAEADATPARERDGSTSTTEAAEGDGAAATLVAALAKVDPFLRFLTKATGKTSVPVALLERVVPKAARAEGGAGSGDANDDDDDGGEEKRCADGGDGRLNDLLRELTRRGVLQYDPGTETVGFPPPPSPSGSSGESSSAKAAVSYPAGGSILPRPPAKLAGKGLHGSTEAAAKRRMKVLKWTLERVPSWICGKGPREEAVESQTPDDQAEDSKPKAKKCKRRGAKPKGGDGEASSTGPKSTSTQRKRRKQNSKSEQQSAAGADDANQPQPESKTEAEERLGECSERRAAYQALDDLLRGSVTFPSEKSSNAGDEADANVEGKPTKLWLPCQAAFAGSHPARDVRYGTLSKETLAKIPDEILQLFDLDLGRKKAKLGRQKRRLFLHQARAIESAMNNVHTVVQTATGSGKSLCFLLPVLAKAMRSPTRGGDEGAAAILLFPTKALAQDQYTKIEALLRSLASDDDGPGSTPLRAGVIDGDTPHSQRDAIAADCRIVLTNPDTLHAALLPNWKKRPAYQKLLARIATVVVDEGHVYEGAFGAHVAMVLARLKRVCRVASSPSNDAGGTPANRIAFVACSATMLHPEEHFRLLCPIGKDEEVCVLTPKDDGSPCPAKHFFVWNPPILDVNGNTTNSVFLPKKAPRERNDEDGGGDEDQRVEDAAATANIPIGKRKRKRRRLFSMTEQEHAASPPQHSNLFTRRRHAADETAFLLAKAISAGVRTIAFCKTRSLVEWVYERTLSILQSSPITEALASKVESYRGGYTAEARRSIEERLFQRKLIGVVGTCALELGVDVGGVDLTLHTGYPGSISSLLQQSGRAGRGKVGRNATTPSCAIMVSFSSPSEQYIWKSPQSLLSKGVHAPPTLPINGTVMQGHLLCAGEEFPLTGDRPVSCLLNEFGSKQSFLVDSELLGPDDVYKENIDFLVKKGLLSCKKVNVVACRQKTSRSNEVDSISVHSTHPVCKDPWKRVSLRSIEPLSYSIVDLSHNLQGGKTDKLHHRAAVMDTIPYSRVFYHAFPGSIIMHRGRKYRIESMENPPPFVGGSNFGPCGCSNLLAFAKPTRLTYSTQALSVNQITVVKQIGHAEVCTESNGGESPRVSADNEERRDKERNQSQESNDKAMPGTAVAGNGVVTVKRTVHGYKKLSHVNRKELSRSTICLPPMEFDTYALWIDADAINLRDVVFNFDGGVHALSHAMVAVAPLFVSCTSADIDCDHARFDTTRILLYDQRAGGSGITAQLYNFIPDALNAAIELLEECTSCHKGFDGGCPACLQSVPCDNFHQDLSRSAGIHIGKHLIKRLVMSNLKSPMAGTKEDKGQSEERNLVQSKLRGTDGVQSSLKPVNILIGRTSWSPKKERPRWAEVDE